MNDLKERTDVGFKHLIGEKVEVEDCNGKKIIGELQFAGTNDTFGIFQVTISRMPIWPVNKSSIKKVTTE